MLIHRKKRIWAVLLLVGIVALAGPYLFSRLRSPTMAISISSSAPASVEGPLTSVRIATYNIAHGRGPEAGASNWGGMSPARRRRLSDIAQLLAGLDLDVVVLNEVDFQCVWSGHVDQAQLIADAAGFPHLVRQRNVDVAIPFASLRFGNAILSKHPIERAELKRFPPRSKLEQYLFGNHESVLATLALPGNRSLHLWAVHFDSREESVRIDAARSVIEQVRKLAEPIVLAGDLNSEPIGGAVGVPRAPATALDLLRQAGLFENPAVTAADRPAPTFPSSAPVRCIDWILVPNGWRASDYRVIPSDLSDHLPVVATVALPAG